jgi:HK97 family phage portal protein
MTGIFANLINEERSLIERTNRSTEQRSSLENPQTTLGFPSEWLLDIFNGGRTDSGIRVSELSAFGISTFLACVDLISKAIASLPANIYERSFLQSGRKVNRPAYDHDLCELFTEPNEDMSWNTFIQAYMLHALVWGNAYGEIQRDKANGVVAIWPRNPSKTRPKFLTQAVTLPPVPWRPFPVSLQAGDMVYETTDGVSGLDLSEPGASSQPTRLIAKEDMLHLQGMSFDGRCAQSLVWLARDTLGLALATSKFSAKYFANYAKPTGILEMPPAPPQDVEQTRRSWMEAQGGENSHRIAVMRIGTKFTPISNNPQDSQMIETRKNIVIEIATMFHVPPHMVGDTSSTKSTTEQQGQEFLTICLQPWLAALKTEFKRKLFPNPTIAATGRKPKKNAFFIDFDLHNLLRPTAADREAYYKTMWGTGAFCINDILELEGRNPIDEPWAEKHLVPVNMQDIENPVVTPDNPQHPNDPNKPSGTDPTGSTDPTEEQPATDTTGEAQPSTDPDAEVNSLFPLYSRLFRDAVGRILAREKPDTKAFQRTFEPVLFAVADMIYSQADRAYQPGDALPADTAKFVKDFTGAMEKRSTNWSRDDADEQSSAELRRALGAIHLSVSKTMAIKKAKAEAINE